jgi:hypothetical protein
VQLRLAAATRTPTTELVMGQPTLSPAAANIPAGTTLAIPGSGYTVRVVSVGTDTARVQVYPTSAPPAPPAPPAPEEPPAPPGPEEPPTQRFSDVSTRHPFHRHIEWFAESGITTGYPDGTFRPDRTVPRDAMAAFLFRDSGTTSYTAPSTPPFSDVSTRHPFYREVSWLTDRGITEGYRDGTYGASLDVSRGAMAAFLFRYQGDPQYIAPQRSPFTDVATHHRFYREIAWMAERGLTTGYRDGTFRPNDGVSRAAMAAFFYRLHGHS